MSEQGNVVALAERRGGEDASTQLTTRGPASGWLQPADFKEAADMAAWLCESGIGSPSTRKNPAAMLMVMGHGSSLGYSIMESVQVFHVIEGRITMEATAQRARALEHPDCLHFDIEATDMKATATMEWKGWKSPKTLTVTIEEARRSKWGMKGGGSSWKDNSSWIKTPSDMLAARVTTRAIRRWVPFVLGSSVIYSPEEAVDAAVIEVEPQDESHCVVRQPGEAPEEAADRAKAQGKVEGERGEELDSEVEEALDGEGEAVITPEQIRELQDLNSSVGDEKGVVLVRWGRFIKWLTTNEDFLVERVEDLQQQYFDEVKEALTKVVEAARADKG
ncbi:MAG: recombinase RecT [Deltaproteobacteria bacterium]|nr:recombinase RecT [Deltaproteobacteria bacterium]